MAPVPVWFDGHQLRRVDLVVLAFGGGVWQACPSAVAFEWHQLRRWCLAGMPFGGGV